MFMVLTMRAGIKIILEGEMGELAGIGAMAAFRRRGKRWTCIRSESKLMLATCPELTSVYDRLHNLLRTGRRVCAEHCPQMGGDLRPLPWRWLLASGVAIAENRDVL